MYLQMSSVPVWVFLTSSRQLFTELPFLAFHSMHDFCLSTIWYSLFFCLFLH